MIITDKIQKRLNSQIDLEVCIGWDWRKNDNELDAAIIKEVARFCVGNVGARYTYLHNLNL